MVASPAAGGAAPAKLGPLGQPGLGPRSRRIPGGQLSHELKTRPWLMIEICQSKYQDNGLEGLSGSTGFHCKFELPPPRIKLQRFGGNLTLLNPKCESQISRFHCFLSFRVSRWVFPPGTS